MNEPTSNSANPYAPPTAAVRDVGAPDGVLEQAERGTRFGAALLDGLVGLVCVYLPVVFGVGFSALRTRSVDFTQTSAVLGVGIAMIGLVVWLIFTLRYVSANGQTIAKRWLGIKVVRTDGSKVGLGRIFWMRNFIGVLIGIIPIVGFIYSLVDPLFIFGEKRRCVHDLIADTMVVNA